MAKNLSDPKALNQAYSDGDTRQNAFKGLC